MGENLISMEIHQEIGAINKRIGELRLLSADARENLKNVKRVHAAKEAGEKELSLSTIHHMKLEDELIEEIRGYEEEITRLEERRNEITDKPHRQS